MNLQSLGGHGTFHGHEKGSPSFIDTTSGRRKKQTKRVFKTNTERKKDIWFGRGACLGGRILIIPLSRTRIPRTTLGGSEGPEKKAGSKKPLTPKSFTGEWGTVL